jgi:SPP1 gp7 family putative phage head morphogenesis protein
MQKAIKLKPIRYPLSHEMTYRSAMLVIIEQMRQQLYNELTSNNAQTNVQYQKIIDDLFSQYMNNPMLGVSLATSFVKSLDKYHQKLFLSGVKQAIGVDVKDFISKSAINDLMQQAISWNVELIKSIPAELLPQVKQVVAQSFSELGFNQANLKKEIDKRFNVTKSRAKLIARDQTSKTVGSMTMFRQKALGINEYIWLGVGDNRERQSHLDNNNKRFSYDNPPADTGNPSHDVNCRCVAQGIITEKILNNLVYNKAKVI